MITRTLLPAVCLMLCSCIHTQLVDNTLDSAKSVEELRVRQLLNNISDAIDSEDRVPSLVVISGGQAQNNVSGTAMVSLPSMNLASKLRTFGLNATNGWTDYWSLTPSGDPQDLQNLRTLYRLLYSTDTDVAQMILDTGMLHGMTAAALAKCGIAVSPLRITDAKQAMRAYSAALKAFPIDPPEANCYDDKNASLGVVAQLSGYYGLAYPRPENVRTDLRNGLSKNCREYQITYTRLGDRSEKLFTRWLYWKGNAGEWRPEPPPPGVDPEPIVSGYTFGDSHREFLTTARACLSDFIILAINATANSHAAALASPKQGPTPNPP